MSAKLESNKIWKDANAIAEYMYSILGDFPIDETWVSGRKIRSASNDLIFYVAQGIAYTVNPGDEYDWANAKKQLFSLKTIYEFSIKQGFVAQDPSIVVKIDRLFDAIDKELEKAKVQTEDFKNDDIKHWQKKYKIWKSMNEAKK